MKSNFPQYEEICLASLGKNQALVKQVDNALREAVKDIADPNKDITKKRKVIVQIIFDPEKDHSGAAIEYKVETKFPGDAPGIDMVIITQSGEGAVPMVDQLDFGLDGIQGVADEEGT